MDGLKQLISQTLEQRGVLAKIRAELRHHVFLALDEQESQTNNANVAAATKSPIASKKKKLAELQANPLAVDLLELVKEYLEFYELEYTTALLNTEAEASGTKVNRKLLADRFSLPIAPVASQPLLLELLQQRQSGSGSDNGTRSRESSSRRDAPPATASVSPREDSASRASSSSRNLYREPKEDKSPTATQTAEKQREREQEERKQKLADSDKISPRNALPTTTPLAPATTLASAGGSGGLAPLGSLKKAPLGSLAPLGGSSSLSKPSLGALTSVPKLNVAAALEKKSVGTTGSNIIDLFLRSPC